MTALPIPLGNQHREPVSEKVEVGRTLAVLQKWWGGAKKLGVIQFKTKWLKVQLHQSYFVKTSVSVWFVCTVHL